MSAQGLPSPSLLLPLPLRLPKLSRLFLIAILPLLQLPLALLAQETPGSDVRLQLTLQPVAWEGSGHAPLSSPAAVSCVHCALLCSRTPECVTLSCPAGRCRLLGCPAGSQPLPGGQCQAQCDAGWSRHGDACYITETTSGLTKNWDDSQAHCESLRPGAQLASVHSAEENEFLWALYRDNGYSRAWVGLEHLATAADASLEFRWADGSALDYTNWEDGQPNDNADDPLGVFIKKSSGEWVDYPKTRTQYLTQICKYSLN